MIFFSNCSHFIVSIYWMLTEFIIRNAGRKVKKVIHKGSTGYSYKSVSRLVVCRCCTVWLLGWLSCVCLNVCIHSQVSLSAPAPYSFFCEHILSICYVQSLVLVAVVWELIRTETLYSGYISLSTALHVLFVTVYLYHKKR